MYRPEERGGAGRSGDWEDEGEGGMVVDWTRRCGWSVDFRGVGAVLGKVESFNSCVDEVGRAGRATEGIDFGIDMKVVLSTLQSTIRWKRHCEMIHVKRQEVKLFH